MIVQTGTDQTVSLKSPEDFTSFKVTVSLEHSGNDDLKYALHGIAEVQGPIRVGEGRIRPGPPARLGRRFRKMVTFVMGKNWVRSADGAIRAHIELGPPSMVLKCLPKCK